MDLIDKAKFECMLKRERKAEMKRREEFEKLHPTRINPDNDGSGCDLGIAFSQD